MRHALFVMAVIAVFSGLALLIDPLGIAHFTTRLNPLFFLWISAVSLALGSFTLSVITKEYSWVDRTWSIAPVVYAWFLAARAWPDARLMVAAVLVTLWGARLTFNFARKGGYTGVEDYRWAEVRKKFPNEATWQVFNLLFISFYQNILILLITLPLYGAFLFRGKAWNALDTITAILFAGFLVLETWADQQQWDYQQAKKTSPRKNRGVPGGGFVQDGLFRFSRHPNYFAEICIWWCIYFFSVSATGRVFSWTMLGAVLLVALFIGSTLLTESISARKYPGYAAYRLRTSMIIPWMPREDKTGPNV